MTALKTDNLEDTWQLEDYEHACEKESGCDRVAEIMVIWGKCCPGSKQKYCYCQAHFDAFKNEDGIRRAWCDSCMNYSEAVYYCSLK